MTSSLAVFEAGKINASDKIMLKTKTQRENMEINDIFA